jgi:hypothetical protein
MEVDGTSDLSAREAGYIVKTAAVGEADEPMVLGADQ